MWGESGLFQKNKMAPPNKMGGNLGIFRNTVTAYNSRETEGNPWEEENETFVLEISRQDAPKIGKLLTLTRRLLLQKGESSREKGLCFISYKLFWLCLENSNRDLQ